MLASFSTPRNKFRRKLSIGRRRGWGAFLKMLHPGPGTPEYDELHRKQEAERARDKSHDPKPEHCRDGKTNSIMQFPIDRSCSTDNPDQ